MTVVGRLLQGEGDAGAQPLRGFLCQAKPNGDGVGGAKADAPDVARQPVGVFRHHLDGVVAIGLENPNRARGPHAVGMQKHHDVAHRLLLGPAGGDLPARISPMPDTSRSRTGSASTISKVASPNAGDALGELGADAAHHAGAEVFLDPLGGRRRRGLEEVGLELQPMRPVGEPDADGVDELAGRNRRRMADDGDEIAVAARLHLQDGESAVLVMEGDALDRADERFPVRCFRRVQQTCQTSCERGGCRRPGVSLSRPPMPEPVAAFRSAQSFRDRLVDGLKIKLLGVEFSPGPTAHGLVLLVLGIAPRFQEVGVSACPANVLGRARSFAGDASRIFDAAFRRCASQHYWWRNGRRSRKCRGFEVAFLVVIIREHEVAQPDLGGFEGLMPGIAVLVEFRRADDQAADIEFVEVAVRPAKGRLKHFVELREVERDRQLKGPTISGSMSRMQNRRR